LNPKRFLIVVALAAALAACASSPGVDEALPVDPAVTVGRLANGFTYYIRANSKPENTAELRLVVNAGSVLEDEDQRGLAHFVEHMAFNGTRSFPEAELVRHLEAMGIEFGPEINASTSFDETVYRLQVPTRSWENLDTGLRILSEWSSAVTFADAEIEKERGVIREEWRTGRGAEGRMRDAQLPILFAGSRYADRLPIGLMEIIDHGAPQRLRDFYREWYRPELMAVVVVGDLDATRVEARIRELFGPLGPPPGARQRPSFGVPDHSGLQFAIATDPEATASQVALYVKRPVERTRTVADYRANIVRSLVATMLNSRIDEVVQRPGSPLLQGGTWQGDYVRGMGATYLGGRTKDGMVSTGLEALLAEAERARRFGFTESELAREKASLLAELERLYATRADTPSGSYAREYVGNYLNGETIPGIEVEYRLHQRLLAGIGLPEVNALAAGWIGRDNAVLMVSAPSRPGLAPPAQAELAAAFDRVAALALTPYQDSTREEPLIATPPAAGRVVEERQIAPIGVTWWRLANGAQVYVKPTDFKKDEVLFRALSPGGTSLVSDADYDSANASIGILQESGLGAFSKTELEKKLAGKQVAVQPYLSEIYEGFEGSSSTRDLETMLQLVYLSFTAPRADEAAFRTYRDRLLERVSTRLSNPNVVFGDTVRLLLAGRDRRAEPLTPDKVKALSLERALAVYRQRFAAGGDFTFVLAGDLDPAKLKPLVETYLGGLARAAAPETWRDRGVTPPEGKVDELVRGGLDPVSRVQYVFATPAPWSFDEDLRLEALSGILENRLTDVLREQQGGTYSPGVFSSFSKNPRGERRVYVGFGCAPQRVEELSALMLAEVARLREGGPDAAAVARQKEIMRRNTELAAKTNAYWAEGIATALRRQEDPQALLRRMDAVQGLDPASLADEARRALATDRYVRVVLVPEREQAGAPPAVR
jgi:zinc protease